MLFYGFAPGPAPAGSPLDQRDKNVRPRAQAFRADNTAWHEPSRRRMATQRNHGRTEGSPCIARVTSGGYSSRLAPVAVAPSRRSGTRQQIGEAPVACPRRTPSESMNALLHDGRGKPHVVELWSRHERPRVVKPDAKRPRPDETGAAPR